MTDNFAEHPRSIAEIKSDKSRSAADWTPRDVLISILRDIDSGELEPEALVVCLRPKPKDGVASTQFAMSSPDIHVSLGLLARVAHRMQE